MEDPVIVEVENDTEESGFYDETTIKSGVESETSLYLSDNRGDNPSDGICTNKNSTHIYNDHEESDKHPKSDRYFEMEEYVNINSAFLDTQGKYLQDRWSDSIDTDTDISQELVSNFGLCQDLLDVYRIQILLFEDHIHRVRSTEVFDEVELKMKIERTKLSHEMKTFLKTLATQGIALLRKVNLLEGYVEISPTKECTIKECKGNNMPLKVNIDMLTLSDKPSPWIQDEIKPPEDPDDPDDFPFLKVSSLSTRSKERAKLKRNDSIDCSYQDNKRYRECGISILTQLSLRTSVPSQSVFKQYLLRIMDSDMKTYLLIYHIGPLVEEWKIVLYQYRGNRETQLPRNMSISKVPIGREGTYFPIHAGTDAGTSMSEPATFKAMSDGQELTEMDCDKEEGRALCCIVSEALTGDTTKELIEIPIDDEEDDEIKEDEVKYLEKPENESQIENTAVHKEIQENDTTTVEYRQLLLKQVITFWEENEGRLTYQVTELKECLKYNILPVPNIQKKIKHKTKKRHKRN